MGFSCRRAADSRVPGDAIVMLGLSGALSRLPPAVKLTRSIARNIWAVSGDGHAVRADRDGYWRHRSVLGGFIGRRYLMQTLLIFTDPDMTVVPPLMSVAVRTHAVVVRLLRVVDSPYQ